jgi:hypothetical protein
MLAALASYEDARAQPVVIQPSACTSEPEAGVPVRIPVGGPADFGVLPEACAATSLALHGRAAILVAEPDYYGSLYAAAALRARVALPGGPWLSLWAPGPEYRFVANATVEGDSGDLSAGTLGLHVPLAATPALVISPYVRLLIPTETVFARATRSGFEHGVSAVTRLGGRAELIGGWAMPILLTHGGARVETTFMPTFSADLVLTPWRALAVAVGLALRVVPIDPEPLESIDPRASLRLYPWRGALVDLSGALPLAGRDRTGVAVALAIGWTWGS